MIDENDLMAYNRRLVEEFRANRGYGKDSFPGQPYELFNLQEHVLHHIYAIVYEKSFI